MNLIASVDNNWGIGNKGGLLVKIKKDLVWFKELTQNKVVVYGRETIETFPSQKPLKNRINILLTRDLTYQMDGAIIVYSIEDLFSTLKSYEMNDVYVIGGQSIYEQLLPYASKAYITKIYHSFTADRYFPDLSKSEEWKLLKKGEVLEENGIQFSFNLYENSKKKSS